MITIVLGFLVGIGIMAIFKVKENSDLILAISLGFFAILCVGLFLPISGYTDWQLVDERELISFSNQNETEKDTFVIRNQDAYLYRIENKSSIDNASLNSYSTINLYPNGMEVFRIDEIEDAECIKPVVKTYERKGKMSLFTFAIGAKQKYYAFIVPKNTIEYEL